MRNTTCNLQQSYKEPPITKYRAAHIEILFQRRISKLQNHFSSRELFFSPEVRTKTVYFKYVACLGNIVKILYGNYRLRD